ncbi:hypothetical protein MRB53_004881 [Persea americana]|uniref:Uncharacterized protein n=1 Tax=Persea americana TaxID=3435 RepID=A0ACC2MC04_PERAE|nr:hypothetical protein MRB53_004881 [Persea americana]
MGQVKVVMTFYFFERLNSVLSSHVSGLPPILFETKTLIRDSAVKSSQKGKRGSDDGFQLQLSIDRTHLQLQVNSTMEREMSCIFTPKQSH